ncbi:Pectate lyase [Thalictrum thalictroides]|uniref:Pectate lyase n=1 Tax=Thalictrum thalictroides TaxID=46969 RepID=A0A7J6VP15_THATH|nr:Pectate lyase [Thalictrum thalictroides]
MASSCVLRIIVLSVLLFALASPSLARRPRRIRTHLNTIDRCWRRNRNWSANRQQLATCSVGFAGKMTNNIGKGLIHYKVTDPSDDPMNPRYGTLRYGATKLGGKVWITFQRDMHIKLQRKLMVSSFTTIDGRGANVHIAHGAGFLLNQVHNVIIHGLHFHHLRALPPGSVIAPGSTIAQLHKTDGDAIRLIGSSKVWIDHNTLNGGQDGLIDVTVGSTDITISNNWFKDHDKVMLLGHDDGYVQDKNMRATIVYNRFGPNCNQRMPRIRHGYAHIANNFYQGWGDYAIGGTMNPTVRSEANLFIAPKTGNKEVTWKPGNSRSWNWRSVNDLFLNGARFSQTGKGPAQPHYSRQQRFRVARARNVRSLTRSAGALRCSNRSRRC